MSTVTLGSTPHAKRLDLLGLLDRSVPALYAVAVLVMVCGSLGQVTRWDLLEQIAMMDSAANGGSLYPSPDTQYPHGVSVYFPGAALLAGVIAKLGGSFYVVEIMHLIACVVVVAFLEMLRRASMAAFGATSPAREFFPLAIAVVFFVCPVWLYYAREFKPDTIAMLMGMAGLITANWLRPDVGMLRIITGALLFGLAIVFKQQYIAFLFGLVVFALFRPSRGRTLFTAIAVLAAASVFYFSHASVRGWYWNVTILADDGFIGVMQILMDNFHTAAAILQVAILWMLFARLPGFSREPGNAPGDISLAAWLRSPWLWVSVPATGAAFLSALKVGGNAGNTQLGLILLLPLFYHLSRHLNRRIFTALAWCALISHLTTFYVGPTQYLEARRLKAFLQNEMSVPDGVALTGSNVYFASRVLADKTDLVNYWTLDVRNNVDPGTANSLPGLLQSMRPAVLIVENWPQNKAAIQADARYRMVYENSIGLVALLKSN